MSRRALWGWIGFGLLVFVAMLLAYLPARTVLERAVDPAFGLRFSGISGTAWNGHAGEVSFQNAPVGSLAWRLSPFALLRGATAADLTLSGPLWRGVARLEQRGARLRIENADLHLPASALDSALDVPNLRFSGDVNLKLDALEVNDSVPTELSGEAIWRQAAVAGAAQATLGTLRARFSGSAGSIAGTLSDDGDGALQLAGEFSLNPLGYKARATLRARGDNPQLREALLYIGQPRGDGSVEYVLEGGLFGGRR